MLENAVFYKYNSISTRLKNNYRCMHKNKYNSLTTCRVHTFHRLLVIVMEIASVESEIQIRQLCDTLYSIRSYLNMEVWTSKISEKKVVINRLTKVKNHSLHVTLPVRLPNQQYAMSNEIWGESKIICRFSSAGAVGTSNFHIVQASTVINMVGIIKEHLNRQTFKPL